MSLKFKQIWGKKEKKSLSEILSTLCVEYNIKLFLITANLI